MGSLQGSQIYIRGYEVAEVPERYLAGLDRYLVQYGVKSTVSVELPGFKGGLAEESVSRRDEVKRARRLARAYARSHGFRFEAGRYRPASSWASF